MNKMEEAQHNGAAAKINNINSKWPTVLRHVQSHPMAE
jgi:hypothetical protein